MSDNRTNEPTPTPTAVCDVIAETIRLVDGSHSMGAGELGEHIEATLRDRGLLVQEPDKDAVERAARGVHGLSRLDLFEDYHPSHQAEMRRIARAALTAAGVAPQEPSEIVDDAADEQVEAAAKALFTSGKQGNVWIITHGKPWEETWSEYRKAFRESARAALEAAAPEPDWGYRARTDYGRLVAQGSKAEVEMAQSYYSTPLIVERRRKAGPWEPLPVGGEGA